MGRGRLQGRRRHCIADQTHPEQLLVLRPVGIRKSNDSPGVSGDSNPLGGEQERQSQENGEDRPAET